MSNADTMNPLPSHALVACTGLPNAKWRLEYGPRCSPRPCRHPAHNIKGRLGTCGCPSAECAR